MPIPTQTPQPQRGKPLPAPPRVSRVQRMQTDGIEPTLPDAGAGAHLLPYLFEAGPVSHAGMSTTPLAWVELEAWSRQVGVELQPWEARTLRRLSSDWVTETRRAEAPDALSPMSIMTTAEQRASVARRIGLEFGAMAAAQRQKGRLQ